MLPLRVEKLYFQPFMGKGCAILAGTKANSSRVERMLSFVFNYSCCMAIAKCLKAPDIWPGKPLKDLMK